MQFIQCFSLSKRILKQDALEALAPPPQCSHSVGEQSGSSEAVGLCMLRVKYDLKSGLKFVQETRIFIAPDDEEILVESDEQHQRSWPTLPQTVLAQGAGQWPSTTCREESPQPLGGTGKAELTWPCWVSQTPSLDSRDTGSVLDPLLYLIPF